MRIIDKNGNELASPDLSAGKLVEEQIFITHHEAVEAVEEQWHHKVVQEYPNGGKDVRKVVDVPAVEAKEAWDEYETVLRYVPYTEEEKNAPKELSIEERVTALEKAAPAPADYTAGTWYYRGDKMAFVGAIYTCIAPEGVVCVWSPAEYAAYWQRN